MRFKYKSQHHHIYVNKKPETEDAQNKVFIIDNSRTYR